MWLDVVGQRELLASGEVSAGELVEASIRRIEALNPKLNAVIHTQFETARERPGIPFLLKDVLTTEAGEPYHCGLRAARDRGYVATQDSELVTRYKRAGFTVLGRTNTPELAGAVTTEPLAYGPTRNPWDPTRTPGGSSGGSAAAVASGMVAAATGNDMGGSIRVPASNCGLVGLKPTRARTTLAPSFGEFWGPLTHQHVLTRSVRDCAVILDETAGPAPGDPYTAPPPARPWIDEVGADPGQLRIGFRTVLPGGGQPHEEVGRAVTSTAQLLESLGHAVHEAGVPALDDPAMSESVAFIFAGSVARDVARWGETLGADISSELEPGSAFMHSIGSTVTADEWLRHTEVLQSWSRRMAAIWQDCDVLVLPVLPEPPVRLGEMTVADSARLIAFTVPYNVTGEPAMSLPLHRTPDGLPIGVQFVAPAGREDTLFRLAGQLEAARPWAGERPVVS